MLLNNGIMPFIFVHDLQTGFENTTRYYTNTKPYDEKELHESMAQEVHDDTVVNVQLRDVAYTYREQHITHNCTI